MHHKFAIPRWLQDEAQDEAPEASSQQAAETSQRPASSKQQAASSQKPGGAVSIMHATVAEQQGKRSCSRKELGAQLGVGSWELRAGSWELRAESWELGAES